MSHVCIYAGCNLGTGARVAMLRTERSGTLVPQEAKTKLNFCGYTKKDGRDERTLKLVHCLYIYS